MHRNRIPTTYVEARETLGGRKSRTVANNTTLVDLGDGEIGLRLHWTYVVRFFADGRISLHTGGWQTVTTKDRLNRVALAQGFRVFSDKRVWKVARFGAWRDAVEFEDGFTIPPAAPRESEPREWKDGEVGYCLGLVRSRGDGSVPRGSVESYLKVQVASATRDKVHVIAADLARAAHYVGQDKWEAAERVLDETLGNAALAVPEPEPGADFTVEDHGTVFLVRPQNDAAREHLEENVEESAQWFGGALAVEHRCILNLVALLREEGYAVGGAA